MIFCGNSRIPRPCVILGLDSGISFKIPSLRGVSETNDEAISFIEFFAF